MQPDAGEPTSPVISQERRFPYIRVIGSLATLGLLVWILGRQGWGQFLEALRRIPIWIILLTCVFMALSRLTVCGRWYTLLRSAGEPVRPGQVVRLVFAGLFASNFLPTTVGGDVARLAGAVRLGFNPAVSAASLVMDRLVGMAGMATALPAGLAVVIPAGLPLPQVLPQISLALPAGLAGRLKRGTARLAASLGQAFRLWASRPRDLFKALFWTYGHMLSLFATVWLLFMGMGASVPFWQIAGLWSLVYFITLLPVSINGLGVQEVAVAYLYSTYSGVPLQAGLAAAVVIRMLYLLASLPGAAFLPGLLEKGSQVPARPGKAGQA